MGNTFREISAKVGTKPEQIWVKEFDYNKLQRGTFKVGDTLNFRSDKHGRDKKGKITRFEPRLFLDLV